MLPTPVRAWSETGHHLIALMAYDLLTPDEQARLLEILAAHPRFDEDFKPPAFLNNETEVLRWRIGRAGYWPDIARRDPQYHRGQWHYQLGAALVLGDAKSLDVPKFPGPLPSDATMETEDLYIAQATELCRNVLADKQQTPANRALAVSWLAHLVADAHQPCHAGSLYAAVAFPEGDMGANRIPVGQRQNLHALWDGLLGGRLDTRDIPRRIREITENPRWPEQAQAATEGPAGLDPLNWLQESRQAAREHVYTPEVLEMVERLARGVLTEPEPIELSEAYLKNAGQVAQGRAALAAYRLAAVWRKALN